MRSRQLVLLAAATAFLAGALGPTPALRVAATPTARGSCPEPHLPVYVARSFGSSRTSGIPQVWPAHSVQAPGVTIAPPPPEAYVDTDGDGVSDGLRVGPGDDAPVARLAYTTAGASITVDGNGMTRTFITPDGIGAIPAGASVAAYTGDDGRTYLALIIQTFRTGGPSEFRAFWDLYDPCRNLPSRVPEDGICDSPHLPAYVARSGPQSGFAQVWPEVPSPVFNSQQGDDYESIGLLDVDGDGAPDVHALPLLRARIRLSRADGALRLEIDQDGERNTYTVPPGVDIPSDRPGSLSGRRLGGSWHVVWSSRRGSGDEVTAEVAWDLDGTCAVPLRKTEAVPASPAVGVEGRSAYTG